MAKIFLSHSAPNNAEAIALSRWLAANGWNDIFLDLDPARGVAAGERWQRALAAAAHRCEAVIFLLSPQWAASRWCQAEFLLAKTLNKLIFGVIVVPIPLEQLPVEMTTEWQLCDLTKSGEQWRLDGDESTVQFCKAELDRLKQGLTRAGLGPTTFLWPPPEEPDRPVFRGLKALEERDAAIHFGRDEEVTRCLDALRSLRASHRGGFLMVLGASGAGKSSFLRAGLIPHLRRMDRHFVLIEVVRPGTDVVSGGQGLVAGLEKSFARVGLIKNRADIRKQVLQTKYGLHELTSELRSLHHGAVAVSDRSAEPPVVVLPLDQGEELYSLSDARETSHFLASLPECFSNGDAICIVTCRSDAYDQFQRDARLAGCDTYLFDLRPMPQTRFHDVIEGPLRRLNASNEGSSFSLDKALINRLVDEARGADALPLLGFTLERLWLEYKGKNNIALSDFEAMGGFDEAINAAAEQALNIAAAKPGVPTDRRAQLQLLRSAFIPWLVRIDPESVQTADGSEPQRRRARASDIPEAARPLLDTLVEARLLVRDRQPGSETGDATYEVAHEALLRRWSVLRQWVQEEQSTLRALEAARQAARDWDQNERDSDWLIHKGDRLVELLTLMRRPELAHDLGETGAAYVAACGMQLARAEADKQAAVRAVFHPWRNSDGRAWWLIPALFVLGFYVSFPVFGGTYLSIQNWYIFPALAAAIGAKFGRTGLYAVAIGFSLKLFLFATETGGLRLASYGTVGFYATLLVMASIFGQPARPIRILEASSLNARQLLFVCFGLGIAASTPLSQYFQFSFDLTPLMALYMFALGLSRIRSRLLILTLVAFAAVWIMTNAGAGYIGGQASVLPLGNIRLNLLMSPSLVGRTLAMIGLFYVGRATRRILFAEQAHGFVERLAVRFSTPWLLVLPVAVSLIDRSANFQAWLVAPEGPDQVAKSIVSLKLYWEHLALGIGFALGILYGRRAIWGASVLVLLFGIGLPVGILVLTRRLGVDGLDVDVWRAVKANMDFRTIFVGNGLDFLAFVLLGVATRASTWGLQTLNVTRDVTRA